MFRIDNTTAVSQLPLTPPPLAPGFFTDGNPAASLDATILDGWWLNMVQEEILTVITSVGMAPSKTDSGQLHEAVRRIAEASNPDLAGFLPLTGGQLYRPAASDIFRVTADQNQHARIISNVSGIRTWSFGTDPSGFFQIRDDSISTVRVSIDGAGTFGFTGTVGLTGGLTAEALTVRGGVNAGANINATGNLSSALHGVVYSGLGVSNAIGWVWEGAFLSARVDGQSSVGLWVNGAIQTTGPGNFGSLGVSGDANVNNFGVAGYAHVSGDFNCGSAHINGNLGVVNLAQVGGLQVNGSATVSAGLNVTGLVSCYNVECRDFDLVLAQPNIGQISRPGGGNIHIQPTGGGYNLNEVRFVSNNLWLQGPDAWKFQGTGWIEWSDARLKKDINPYPRGLDAIRQLAPVEYAANGLGGYPDDGRRYIGLIAQDCREIMPEMIKQRGWKLHADDAEDTTLFALDTNALQYALVNAVKELADRLDELEGSRPKPAPH